jgi:anaerobic magnesium-protoporphyrin IX monomethyl ester cyclase
MNNKVLITHSYFYKFDPKQWKSKRFYPPLGTLYAASVLRNEGAELIFHDTCLSTDINELQLLIEDHQPEILVIYDDGFNYLTKMCLTNMRDAAFDMIRMGKSKGCKVLVCSSDSTDHYEEYLDKGADYIVMGEGEKTLEELYQKINSGIFDPSSVDGIAYKDSGKIIKNKSRPVIQDLDNLPNPAWDLVDIEKYKSIWMKNHGYFSINLATTRGCPYQCSWCAKPIYGAKYNNRSPENVIAEMEFLINDYGVSHFWICDDIFGLTRGWVSAFRELVIKKRLVFRYTVQSRADLVIRDNVAEDMAASGAEFVWLGAESGSQKILDAMNKGQTVADIKTARKILQKHGVKTAFFIQFGYLGEELNDIQLTINMIMELMPDDIGISVSYPLPGTVFHQQVKNELNQKANWSDSNDLALMYKGTFSPDYYRRLHQYVHRLFRRKQRIQSLKSTLFRLSSWDVNKMREIASVIYYYPAIYFDRKKLKKLGQF